MYVGLRVRLWQLQIADLWTGVLWSLSDAFDLLMRARSGRRLRLFLRAATNTLALTFLPHLTNYVLPAMAMTNVNVQNDVKLAKKTDYLTPAVRTALQPYVESLVFLVNLDYIVLLCNLRS